MKKEASRFKLLPSQNFDKWLLNLVEVPSYQELNPHNQKAAPVFSFADLQLIFIGRCISTNSIQAFFIRVLFVMVS